MRLNNEQRHSGGHWEKYYEYVAKKLDPLYKKYKDTNPCNDEKAKKGIYDRLMSIQIEIFNDLFDKKVWLYEWSEKLYNEDYREEGSGDLTMDNRQGSSSAGVEWVRDYPKGNPRRKHFKNGNLKEKWYESKGFPVPSSVSA